MKELHTLPPYWLKLFADAWFAKSLLATFTASVAYVLPGDTGKAAAETALVLVFLDTLCGVIGARVVGEAISSAKFSRVLVKIFGYSTAVIAASISFKALPGMGAIADPAATAIVSLVVVTETISIFENLRKMGVPLPPWIDQLLQHKEASIATDAPRFNLAAAPTDSGKGMDA